MTVQLPSASSLKLAEEILSRDELRIISLEIARLCDALDAAEARVEELNGLSVTEQICFDKVVAERDSARALLRDIRDNAWPGPRLGARITKEIGE